MGKTDHPRLRRRLELAEDVCRELRHVVTSRVVDRDWSNVVPLLSKWMKAAPKSIRYSRPVKKNT